MSPAAVRALPVFALVALAVALRMWGFSAYAIHHPDEQIQYLEQAYRLVFGTGLVPWEYRLGMRGWLVPLLLAGPMWLGEALAPGTTLYVVLPRIVCAAIALAPLWVAWRIGALVSRRHALMALAVAALWYESVYFSVHVLTETLATALLLPAAALLLGERSPGRLVAAGALLGCAVVVRFHYAPAAAVLALWTLRADWRGWRWLVLGGLVAAAISGGVDLLMGQWPFGWMVENVRQNVVEDKAAQFGVFGVEAYGQMLWLAWSVALVPVVWLAAIGARRFPVLAAVAGVNLLVHLGIGHKEYRFILLTTQLAIVLAAIGSVDVLARFRWGRGAPALAAAVAAWGAASAALAFGTLSDPGWRRHGAGYAVARQASLAGACGIAIFAGRGWAPIGQTWLHRPIPQYYFGGAKRTIAPATVRRHAAAFDAILAPAGHPAVPRDYRIRVCAGEGGERMCAAMRPGGCVRDPATDRREIQRVMIANGR